MPASAKSSSQSRCQRLSMKTETQIDISKRRTSGTTSKASETGSTVGSRIANTSSTTNAIRRFRRSWSLVKTRSRTSASTKIGIRNASPPARSVIAAKV